MAIWLETRTTRDSLRFVRDLVGAGYFHRNAPTAGAGIGAMKPLNTFRFDLEAET